MRRCRVVRMRFRQGVARLRDTLLLSLLALGAAQAAHSVRGFVHRRCEVFAAARAVSGLISANPGRGFAIFTVGLVTSGMWCFIWPLRRPCPWQAR